MRGTRDRIVVRVLDGTGGTDATGGTDGAWGTILSGAFLVL